MGQIGGLGLKCVNCDFEDCRFEFWSTCDIRGMATFEFQGPMVVSHLGVVTRSLTLRIRLKKEGIFVSSR